MRTALPPLKALRAFEASARLRSFKKASEELFVTPSAISQQIKILEDHLEIQLFDRTNHGLIPTLEGQQLLPTIEQAFNSINAAIYQLKNQKAKPLRVSATPAFASNWLAPQMREFKQLAPDIAVRLHSSLELENLGTDFDCAIRGFALNHPAPMQDTQLVYEKLFETQLVAIGNPRKLKNKQGQQRLPERPEQVGDYNLIHYRDYNIWAMWARLYTQPRLATLSGIVCEDIEQFVRSVFDGEGIALVDKLYWSTALAGTPAELLLQSAPQFPMAFYFVYSRDKQQQQSLQVFKDWLLQKINKMQGPYLFGQTDSAAPVNSSHLLVETDLAAGVANGIATIA